MVLFPPRLLLFIELEFLVELFLDCELDAVCSRRDSADALPPALATRSRVSLSADASPRFDCELESCCPRLPLFELFILLFGILVVLLLYIIDHI